MCTRQRKWQRARSAEGKCELCAADAGSGTRCGSCRDKQRKRSRDRYRAAHGIPLDAPKHSTYGGKPRDLSEAEPVYRMLKTGETIQAGDEFRKTVKRANVWTPTQAAGLVMIDEWVGDYRRPLNDSIISEPAVAEPVVTAPKYRMLEAGERIQAGDEYKDDYSRWVKSIAAGAAISPLCVGRYRRRVPLPLVVSCDTRIPTINLQPMKLQ